MKKYLILSLFTHALLIGCVGEHPLDKVVSEILNPPVQEETVAQEPVKPVYKADWSKPEWTEGLSDALDQHGQELLKVEKLGDASTYSFKGGSLEQRKQFWIMLISTMARYESSFRPEVNAYECRKASCVYKSCRKVEGRGFCMLGGHKLDGGLVISRGLMQISLESAQGYGCDVKVPTDLNDPIKNLTCSVKILNRFVPKDGVIGTDKKGGARYWAVLRESSDSRKKIIDRLKNQAPLAL